MVAGPSAIEASGFVTNAKTWGNRFEARLIRSGLVNYRDVKAGVAYVSKETIDRCVNSFVGRPLVIKHTPKARDNGETINRPAPENMERVACGYITNVWYDATDEWFYCDGTIHDDEAKQKIKEGWLVSCAYAGTEPVGPAGKLQGMPYDYERRGFSGEHLALDRADRVRYEAATIVLNSKAATKGNVMFKLFSKEKPAVAAPAAAALTINSVTPETPFEYAPGKILELGQLAANQVRIDSGEFVVANAAGALPAELDPKTEIAYRADRPDSRMTLEALCKNAADKEDADEEAEKKKKEKPVENSKPGVLRLSNFTRLTEAPARAAAAASALTANSVPTNDNAAQIQRGKDLFKNVGKPAA